MMDCPIVLLACRPYYWMLQPFAFLFNIYWCERQPVDVFGYEPLPFSLPDNFRFHSIARKTWPVSRWSDSLIEVCERMDHSDHFILFLEDYWLNGCVNVSTVTKMLDYAREDPTILRVDLTAERVSKKSARKVDEVDGIGIISAGFKARYDISFQSNVWNRRNLMNIMVPGETPWQAEMNGTERVWERDDLKVLGTDAPSVVYKPVYRNHRRSLNLENIPTELLKVMKQRGYFDGIKV